MTSRLSFRARGGYHLTDLSGPSNGHGYAYTAGIKYALSARYALHLDYTNCEVSGPNHLDFMFIGYQRRF